jgi:phosphoglucosamine mutase
MWLKLSLPCQFGKQRLNFCDPFEIQKMMKRNYFGTDGIRGTVGESPITPDFVLKLANAVGHQLRLTEKRPQVVIGKDTRISGYMLESALEAGFNSAGVDVILLGPMPTPGVAYLTKALRTSLGVVISASHNPFEDNGVKFFSAQGTKLDDQWELAVEKRLLLEPVWENSQSLGKARRLDDAIGRYIEFCKSTFSDNLTLKGLKIVVDAAHGAAYIAAPQVFKELGAEVISIGCSPDGLNINHGVGATHPEALIQAVKSHQADFGVALDGDADRLLMVDQAGRLFSGDELLYVLAKDRILQNQPVAGVVGTKMTNRGVEEALTTLNIDLIRANVGDRYVLEKLVEKNWILGGESSGHLLILDKHTTGDGLISCLQILQASLRTKKSLSEILQDVSLYSQVMVNVKLKPDVDWRVNDSFQKACQETEKILGDHGRLLIRPSGTEPVLRIMVEARELATAQSSVKKLANLLE